MPNYKIVEVSGVAEGEEFFLDETLNNIKVLKFLPPRCDFSCNYKMGAVIWLLAEVIDD